MRDVQKRILGIDWGTVRIGLALGDNITKVASPFKVVKNINEIKKIIEKEGIDELVIGQPIKMSGQKENLTKEFEEFIFDLKKTINIPVHLIDERLTSKAADALAGNKKTKAERDAVAAMIILQSFFDKKIWKKQEIL